MSAPVTHEHHEIVGAGLHRAVRFTQDTEPSSTRAGDLWLDPTTGALSQRNEANDGWIAISGGGNGGSSAQVTAINVVIGTGEEEITTGVVCDLELPWAGEIKAVTLLADQTGSIVIDLWRDTYANYPPTDADSITASAKPTISSSNKSQDTSLTGWTTTFAVGDILRVNVDSAATVERVTLSLLVERQ